MARWATRPTCRWRRCTGTRAPRVCTTDRTRCIACRLRGRSSPVTRRPRACGRASTSRRGARQRSASSPRCWKPPSPMPEKLPDYAVQNREVWTISNANYTAGKARESWAKEEIGWGVWHVLEHEVRVLPEVTGLDVIELGCGTAYWGAWLKKLGARRVVGVDITPAQLDTARELNREFGLGLEFIEANAEDVPLPDASFDLAFSEYGASIWCDPYRWVPEAARLLRPGGELIFMRSGTLLLPCTPPEGTRAEERLARDYFGMYRFEWPDDDSVEFHLPHGD